MGKVTIEASKVEVVANGATLEVTLTDIASGGCADKAIVGALGEEWVASLLSTEVLIKELADRGDEVSVAAQCVESSASELQQLLASRWID